MERNEIIIQLSHVYLKGLGSITCEMLLFIFMIEFVLLKFFIKFEKMVSTLKNEINIKANKRNMALVGVFKQTNKYLNVLVFWRFLNITEKIACYSI